MTPGGEFALGSQGGDGAALEPLMPLCPTCQKLIHFRSGGGVYTAEELNDLLSSDRAVAD